MSRILVMGALHHDVVVDAPRLPRLDETLVGHAVDYRFGGKGGNQAVAAARLGAEVAMIGRVGQDAAGAAMLAELDRAGVERSGVQEVAGASGMSVAITDATGGYGAVIVSAANLLNDGRDALPERFGICLMQNEVPEAANLALAARLPGDVRLILNAAPARPIDPALLARCGLLVVNRVEAADMARMDDPADASCALAAAGPCGGDRHAGGGGSSAVRGWRGGPLARASGRGGDYPWRGRHVSGRAGGGAGGGRDIDPCCPFRSGRCSACGLAPGGTAGRDRRGTGPPVHRMTGR